jgi:hypothetical protein
MNHIISCILVFICTALVIYACRLSYKAGVTVGREQVLKENLVRLGVVNFVKCSEAAPHANNVKTLDHEYDFYSKRMN